MLEMSDSPGMTALTLGFSVVNFSVPAAPVEPHVLRLHPQSVPATAQPPVTRDVQTVALDPRETVWTHLELPLTPLLVGIPPSATDSAGDPQFVSNVQAGLGATRQPWT